MIRAILFDLDNTLYDRDESFLHWAQWFVRERLGIQEDDPAGATIDLLVRLDANGYGAREALFGELKQHHPALTDRVEALTAAFYQEHLSWLTLTPETRFVLDYLQQLAIPIGIITNGSALQQLKIRQLGLDRYTRCIFISALVGMRKPEPAIFLAAADCLGHVPAETLFVGDNPAADVIGAGAVGMRTAWLRRGQRWPKELAAAPPDHQIDTLSEALPILKE